MTPARGERTPLSRESLADAALAFVDAHGLDALTLRSLGEVVGAHPTALYRHFSGKDDLIVAALDRMYVTSGVTVPAAGTPRERIFAFVRSVRTAFARHPNMALPNLTLQDEQATAEFVRAGLDLLAEMGLEGRDQVICYQMLETFTVGSSAYDFSRYPESLEARRRGRRLVGHPALDEVSRDLDAMQAVNDEAFEVALDALLDACEARAGRTGAL